MGKAFFLAKRRKCRLWPCCCGPALCRHCPVPGCHRLSCLREGGPRPTPFCPMSWPSRSELSSGSNRLFPWTNFNQRPLLFLSCQVTSDFCDSNTLATWCEELTLWKRPWCWQRLRTGAGNRRWDGWMASSTQWTWVWVNPGRWWRTRKCFNPWVAKSQTRLSNWTITMYYIAHQAPSVHGIFQERILEWVAISFSNGSSWPRDQTCVSCIDRWIIYHYAAREAPMFSKPSLMLWPHPQVPLRPA